MKNHLLLFFFVALFITTRAQIVPPPTVGGAASYYGFDVYPVFPKNGGDFEAYIAKHIKKPVITADSKQTISIRLNIDSTGKATVPSSDLNHNTNIEQAFADVIAQSPRWIPATLNGKPVKSTYVASFFVELNQDELSMYVEPSPKARQPKVTGDKIFNAVEVQPSFPGGEEAFNTFVHHTSKFPDMARAKKVSGRVFVEFIVEKDGSLTDLVVMRNPGYGLGDEAIRLLCIGPKWKPGTQNGKPVRVQFIVPINFRLSKR